MLCFSSGYELLNPAASIVPWSPSLYIIGATPGAVAVKLQKKYGTSWGHMSAYSFIDRLFIL